MNGPGWEGTRIRSLPPVSKSVSQSSLGFAVAPDRLSSCILGASLPPGDTRKWAAKGGEGGLDTGRDRTQACWIGRQAIRDTMHCGRAMEDTRWFSRGRSSSQEQRGRKWHTETDTHTYIHTYAYIHTHTQDTRERESVRETQHN